MSEPTTKAGRRLLNALIGLGIVDATAEDQAEDIFAIEAEARADAEPVTGENLRDAIAEACPLINPRLSEVDWYEVAAVLTGMPKPVGGWPCVHPESALTSDEVVIVCTRCGSRWPNVVEAEVLLPQDREALWQVWSPGEKLAYGCGRRDERAEARADALDVARGKVEALIAEVGECVVPDDPDDLICATHSELLFDGGCEDQPRELLKVRAILAEPQTP